MSRLSQNKEFIGVSHKIKEAATVWQPLGCGALGEGSSPFLSGLLLMCFNSNLSGWN